MITIEAFGKLLKGFYTKRVSPRYPDKPPGIGFKRCVDTALVVQDYFGGQIVSDRPQFRYHVIRHCWNILPNGEEVDFTRNQFSEKRQRIISKGKSYPIERDYLLSADWNVKRYLRLKKFIEAELFGLEKSGVDRNEYLC
ncbi:hypothetical protein MYX06_04565 [Patescibacteria group bacterium AH-259-L05]|nr:hypothetical protein [Patescibacteria group bacterium AH-259-L05]